MIPFSDTAVGGPMGVAVSPKIEMISPAATGPVTKLAPLVTRLIEGTGAVTVRDTLIFVVPVALPAPDTVIVPRKGPPALTALGSIVTARLNEPFVGV